MHYANKSVSLAALTNYLNLWSLENNYYKNVDYVP